MPELPDVESFKRYFKKTSLNKKIVDIECEAKNLIRNISFIQFKKKLVRKSFKGASRRGKFLIIKIEKSPENLIIHFGMTGDFYYEKKGINTDRKKRFSRLAFKFKNGDTLHWLNMRKFGKIYLIKDPKKIKLIKEMGPEPLELSRDEFFKLLDRYKDKNIKAFLLDQRNIAGIGNIYSDEILFITQVDPHRKIKTLDSNKRKKIYQVMMKVLKRAIEIMSTSKAFGPSWLLHHRGEDMKCPKNKRHRFIREIIAGRAAVYCPICQK